MKSRLIAAAAGAVGLGVGLLLAPTPATAGHTNTLLTADLTGRAEVAADGSKGVVGDPNGRGEAYVFGIDGDPTTLCYILEVSRVAETELAPGAAGWPTSTAARPVPTARSRSTWRGRRTASRPTV